MCTQLQHEALSRVRNAELTGGERLRCGGATGETTEFIISLHRTV
jgi:hypothetical protein